MEARQVLPQTPLVPPKISLPGGLGVFNPPPHIMCCTMNAVPTTSSLLGKMKLPLAIHIHPYKDVSMHECPVIHPSTIVRCRVCRAYINPFVVFIDSRHWRCNLCFRPNALPEDFDYNAQTGKRGDRGMRMEIKRSSVEYIASSEYMLRPPQPCVYYFIIDVSYNSVNSGVLALTCRCLLDCLGRVPGDARTLVGFLTVDSSLHFYNLSIGNSQPQMMVVSDVDDIFIPSPDSLLVNLKESKDMIRTLLEDMPGIFAETPITECALGAALQVAEKLLHSIGGRVTVIQTCLPTTGPGALKNRDVNPPATKKDTINMAPASDFYKKLALDLSSQQIAVDLFAFSSSQFIDLSTISCVSKFSAGQVFYYPDFHHSQHTSRLRYEKDFTRYLTRKIGFEAVMRIRCTEGISLHTFHGNFFVRSTDLLSLPNTNPDHGYTISLSIDENLKDMSTVCCQAALLYTSSRGERRIRVHTLCLPVSSQPSVLYSKLNVVAITGVLANMAVDRATSSSIGDARDALLNTVVDCTKMYRSQVASANCPPFTLPSSLAQLPLFVLSLLKNPAFTLSSRISYDVRAQTMNLIKSTPLSYLMPTIYPSLYALHSLTEQNVVETETGETVVQAPLLQLSPENTSRYGIFLMDCGHSMYIWVSSDAPDALVSKILGVTNFEAIPEDMTTIPVQDNESSRVVHMLLKQISLSRQHHVSLIVIRERSQKRLLFVERLLDGKTDNGTSYYEFISHILRQLGK
ncbi:Protein transport protein Sec24B [Geodia barretti]|nr:Protein transport protein Sec24B [Geodia barretti]